MSHYQFREINDTTVCFFVNLSYQTGSFSLQLVPYVAFFCMVVNVFHIMILSRKSMRSNCINAVLLGIAIADLLYLAYNVQRKCLQLFFSNDCTNYYAYYRVLFEHWTQRTEEIARFASGWLSVVIALIRVLTVKYPMNPKFDMLSSPWFGVNSVLVTTFASFLKVFSSWGQFRIKDANSPWYPKEKCNFPANYSEPRFDYSQEGVFMADYFLNSSQGQIFDGIAKNINTVMLPILAYMLIKEVRGAEDARSRIMASRSEGSKNNQTTRMILIMTVASMVAEGPSGILVASYVIVNNRPDALGVPIVGDIEDLWLIIIVLNTVSHCFVSMLMSSLYKKTAEEMFMCRYFSTKRSINPINVSSNGPSSTSRGANSVMAKID